MVVSNRWVAIALIVGSAAVAMPASADDLDKSTQDSLQNIIAQQLDAFAHEDAEKAESFAAPGIRAKFPDPKDFVAMVHQSYAPLFQPRSTHFTTSSSSAVGPAQSVTIVDRAGSAWTAVYTFEQVDGQWRINGCALVKEDSTTI